MLAALLAVSHGAPAAPAGYAPAPYESYPDIAPSYNVSYATTSDSDILMLSDFPDNLGAGESLWPVRKPG